MGEWVKDQPKCGVYTEVEDEANIKPSRKHFTDPYAKPPIPELALANPVVVLENAVEEVRLDRAQWRVQHIPLEDM